MSEVPDLVEAAARAIYMAIVESGLPAEVERLKAENARLEWEREKARAARDEARAREATYRAALEEATEALGSAINQYAALYDELRSPIRADMPSLTVRTLTRHHDRARVALASVSEPEDEA